MGTSRGSQGVSTVYVRHLLELLAESGVPMGAVLKGTGLTRAALSSPGSEIPFDTQHLIYVRAAEMSTADDLGIRLGERLRISDHGAFGYAIQSSRNLAQAIRIILRYHLAIGSLVRLAAHTEHDEFWITMEEVTPLGPARNLAMEEVLAIFASQVLTLVKPKLKPRRLLLAFNSDRQKYFRREFECPVELNAGQTTLVIASKDLARKLVLSDAETARVNEEKCNQLNRRLGKADSVVEDVRRAIVSDPRSGTSLDAIASLLNVSGRTLRRRLNDANTSFRAIQEDVRKELTLDYLRTTNLTVDDIADMLGYKATSNFCRAFKRWTGKPPSQFRSSVA